MELRVICFSKDRPFQLLEFLRTFHTFVCYKGRQIKECVTNDCKISIFLICRCTTIQLREEYDAIAARYPNVRLLFEGTEGNASFADLLLQAIDVRSESISDSYVWFHVDDAFYFNEFDVYPMICDFFERETEDQVLAFHVKLSSSIWRSHMTGQPMLPLPELTAMLAQKNATKIREECASLKYKQLNGHLYYTFKLGQGQVDWNYPWDLSGSIYRWKDVCLIMQGCLEDFGPDAISHPNKLELYGNKFLQRKGLWKDARCACLARSVMHLLAVDQVQDVYQNRLCDLKFVGDPQICLDKDNSLETIFQSGFVLNEDYYRSHRFSSVHIGHVAIRSIDTTISQGQVIEELVSVILPVYNGERYIESAVRSLLRQTYTHIQIIIVDDGSTDSTISCIEALSEEDARIVVLRNSSNLGVAASLNIGIRMAKGTFIARMDADDISLPHRIARQMEFLKANPEIDIVGASIMIIPDMSMAPLNDVSGAKVVIYPTSPAILKWQMLFGCFMAHPTVLLRRIAVDRILERDKTLYSQSISICEDYDLWLRCLYEHGLIIANLGDVLLLHRKHEQNASKIHRMDQKDESISAAGRCIEKIVGWRMNTRVLSLLRGDVREFGLDSRTAIDAIDVLQNLSSCFLQFNTDKQMSLSHDDLSVALTYIKSDAAAREGTIALQALACIKDTTAAANLWATYCRRHEAASKVAFAKLFTKSLLT